MILTLELSGAAKPGVATRKVFTESGGTIGRDAKSFWVLPDGEVSGRHALISGRDGVFYIENRPTRIRSLAAIRRTCRRA